MKIKTILKPEVGAALDLYHKKLKIASQEYSETYTSDIIKAGKLRAYRKELDADLVKYTKNILLYIDLSADKETIIDNIVKYAKELKEFTNNSNIDKLINAKKEKGGFGESKYLSPKYLKQKEIDAVNAIYEQIKKDANAMDLTYLDLQEQEEKNAQEADEKKIRDLRQLEKENSKNTEEKLIQESLTAELEKTGGNLRNIYIEPRKIVGAHSSIGSNYDSHIYMGNHAVLFLIIILVLFLLNTIYSKCNNNAIEIDSYKQPLSPKVGQNKINLYRLEHTEMDSDIDYDSNSEHDSE